MRKLNAWGWKQLVRLIFGVRVRAIDCAFKLFRAEFFRTYQLETRGAMINAEILYKLSRAGYTYTEVGVEHLPGRAGKATGAKPSVILRALCEMFIFAEKWRQEQQPSCIVRQAVRTRLKRELSYHLCTRKSSTEKGLSVELFLVGRQVPS